MARRKPTKGTKRKRRISRDKHRRQKPIPAPTGFEYTYGPLPLQYVGPVLLGQWLLPPVVEENLKNQGLPIPKRIGGLFLVDTGASITCISQKAANALGLQATRLAKGHGASGEHENPIYFTRLRIKIQNELGTTTTMQWDQEVMGVPDLEKSLKPLDITFLGEKRELVGLIGRDILRHTLFTYNGSTGKVHIDFHLDPLRKIAAPPP